MLTANGSILHFGSYHPSLRATITKSDLQMAVRVIGLVWFRTSSSELGNFRRMPWERVLTKISRKAFDNLSLRLDLEIFAHLADFEDLSPRVDLEIFAGCRIRASINEDLNDIRRGSLTVGPVLPQNSISSHLKTHVTDAPQVLSFWSLSPREGMETPTGCHWSESPLCTFGDFGNQSGRVDLEIFAPLWDLENLSPRVDLEIFASLGDFENLSPGVDLEIFAGSHSRK
ncbi:hypothetical protein HZH66_013034 [Vespula vulgaris]|uniref:Uncharacterized protein n=1 Tax=Vespula vulgaris TaxID=7454 RepID=A0A834J8Q3_VESVU|nr:hypothetical protein HZH66_013034 [Vespula vulgaris]